MIGAIARNEIRRFLVVPGFWVLAALMQAALALKFFSYLDRFIELQPLLASTPGARGVTDLVVAPTLLDAAALLLLLAPLLAMRSFSEERRVGTLFLLQAAPVSDGRVLTGKFLGLMVMLMFPAILAVIMTTSLAAGTALDFTRIATSYAGLTLTAALTAAAGVWISATTRHPPVAAALLYGLFILLWIASNLGAPDSLEINLVQWLALPTHLQPLILGHLRTGDIGYFAVLTGGFLALGDLALHGLRGDHRKNRSLLRYTLVTILSIAAFWATSWLPGERDLSASGRHSLSRTSLEVLQRLDGPVKLTAYVSDRPAQKQTILDLAALYARKYPEIALTFIDLEKEDEKARELAIPPSGALLVEYGSGSELLRLRSRQPNETTLTSTLQRLMNLEEHWIVSVRGHGERRLDGDGNYDLRDFAAVLKREGYRLHTVDLPETLAIPANTEVLLIADPRASFPLVEQAIIADYLANGGNLLWFADPNPSGAGRWLEDQLPVSVLPGTLVDAQGAGIVEDPHSIAVSSFADHPTTTHLQGTALFLRAAGLAMRATGDDWTSTTLVDSSPKSWNETGDIRGKVERNEDAGETAGPLAIGVALERGDQRVVVFGDADFLSNAYLGNGVNLDLGLNLVRWLTGNDRLLDIPVPSAPDARLDFSLRGVAVLASVFLMLLPLTLLTTGLLIHYRRRRR